MIRPSPRGAAALAAGLALAGCRAPEAPEAAQARSRKGVLERELVELAQLAGKARRGELVTDGQIAIGVSESLVERLLAASLPPKRVLAGRLNLTLEKAAPYFRGGLPVIVIRGRVGSTTLPGARAEIELGGGLRDVHLHQGRLTARVALLHFTVLQTIGGALGKNLVEDAVRANLATVEGWIPPLEIPVLLEEGVNFDGLKEGPVRVGAGHLPLRLTLSHVVPVNERLWLLVQANPGDWEPRPAGAAATP